MAALRYRDKHKKVGYLLKPTRSDDYHQIIDFLRASHIRFPELGPPAIQATIDKTPYTITEDLVRSRLQLADDGGPSMPLLPAMLAQNQEGEGAGVAAQAVPQHMPTLDQLQDHLSTPSRSTQAPLASQPSGGAEDPITLTASSSVVSTLVQKVNSLETELKDHKNLFKDVVGKLVKKVKAMEVKLKTKKRKMVVSDSDQDDGRKHNVDLDALRVLANAAVTVDSNIPPGGASSNPAASTGIPAVVPTCASTVTTGALTVPTDSPSVPVDVPPSVILLVEANASLSKTLLGDDVSEDNFPARMAALIKRKKQALAKKLAKERQNRPMTQAQQRTYMRQFVKNQSCAVYSTGWSMARVKSFTDDQLKEEFEKIQKDISNTWIQAFSRTLKRTGLVFKEPSSKIQKSTEAHIPSVPEVPPSPAVSSPPSSGTRKKSLGNINALYRIDQSTKHFTTLRHILYMVDRQDLVKLYGLVVKFYETHPVVGARLILWGDLQVLFDSHKGGKGSCVWQHQHLWEIRSWRLYTLSNVYVLETVSSEVLYMFADVSYPLSVKLIEKMLMHKLEIDTDVVGNDMTAADQLIQFIKN
nr:aminoacyl-tRNA synthetase, class 1a, anticodon-binding [Tanacetum cinerariifolium]